MVSTHPTPEKRVPVLFNLSYGRITNPVYAYGIQAQALFQASSSCGGPSSTLGAGTGFCSAHGCGSGGGGGSDGLRLGSFCAYSIITSNVVELVAAEIVGLLFLGIVQSSFRCGVMTVVVIDDELGGGNDLG